LVKAYDRRGREAAARRHEHGHLSPDQLGGERRESIELTLRKAKFQRHILAVDITGFLKPSWTAAICRRSGPGDPELMNPTTGIATCCAPRAATRPPRCRAAI
jgi:hypothetical protein